MLRANLPRVAGVVAALSTLAWAGAAHATPAAVYAVWWQTDTTLKTDIDTFMNCLAGSSTFGTTWGQQFGISPVTFGGSIVLTSPPPASVVLGGSLDQVLTSAFDKHLVPAPKAGAFNEYVMFVPPGTTASDQGGNVFCQGSGICGEHSSYTQYNGVQIDISMIPLCKDVACGGDLDQISTDTEHETAEGLADLAQSGYEVGDSCMGPTTPLECCGKAYGMQQLAGAGGPSNCQTITPTGNSCACKATQFACQADTECCKGLVCKPQGGVDGGKTTTACCSSVGSKCTTGADCCGALLCTAGACACIAEGKACTASADCCTGFSCDATTHLCAAPAPVGGGWGSDASSGQWAGDGGANWETPASAPAGCACASAGGSGAPWSTGMATVLGSIGALTWRRRRLARRVTRSHIRVDCAH